MKPTPARSLALAFVLLVPSVPARAASERINEANVVVDTLAGSGFKGTLDGRGAETMFSHPRLIAVGPDGAAIVVGECPIRRVAPDGTVTTPGGCPENAGSLAISREGQWYAAGGGGRVGLFKARFDDMTWHPIAWPGAINDLAIDHAGNVFFSVGTRIRVFAANGSDATVAGGGAVEVIDGKGLLSGMLNATAVAVDQAGNVYFADGYAWPTGYGTCLRRIAPDTTVTTVAGSKTLTGTADGAAASARFTGITSLACDSAGNVFIADGASVRLYHPTGKVTTVAGNPPYSDADRFTDGEGFRARFSAPLGIALANDRTVLVADSQNHRIRRIRLESSIPVEEGALVQMFAGVTVNGPVGARYRIEARPQFAPESAWQPIADVTASTMPFTWIDPASPSHRSRFYRAVRIP